MSHTVLIVDDSALARRDLVLRLLSMGYQVLEAENGRLALDQYLANHAIKLVISDVHMPIMNGLELCEEIKKVPDRTPPKMVIVSTETNDDMKVRGRKAGVNAWVIKPINVDRTCAVIETLLKPG